LYDFPLFIYVDLGFWLRYLIAAQPADASGRRK
jgi:hypothetical protein